jgi:cytochrome c oxidase subunit 3
MITQNIRNNLIKNQAHPYHLVKPSPWPIYLAFGSFGLLYNLTMLMHNITNNKWILLLNLITLIYIGLLWSRDIIAEATYLGEHTSKISEGLNMGFIIFLITELMWFIGVFWAYFHSALSPSIELGEMWPPIGIIPIQATDLPLLNTLILLLSGGTITYSHHGLIGRDYKNSVIGLLLTIILGIIFIICQYIEYKYCSYTMADSIYGSVFFIVTGLHGIHLITGTGILCLNFYRLYNMQLTSTKHTGYNTAILLWHFLDVAWLFVYIICYYWGV